MAGAVVVAAGSFDTGSFSSHMVGHVALGMVGPLLLALGAPVTLALQTARWRAGLRRVVHSDVVAAVTHPVVAWTVFGVTPFVLYFTPLFDLSVRNGLMHGAVHVHLVAVGCLFCWPAVGLDPVRHRLPHGARVLYLFVAVPFHAVLGLAILSSNTPLAPAYGLGDQRAAAGIVWAAGDLFGLVATGVALLRWMAADEREAARADRITAAPPAPGPVPTTPPAPRPPR